MRTRTEGIKRISRKDLKLQEMMKILEDEVKMKRKKDIKERYKQENGGEEE